MMNLCQVINTTSADNQSACAGTCGSDTIKAAYYYFLYVVVAIGIPGNILSAIVWLRRHNATKMSSAVYLAALAINDLVHLPANFVYDRNYNYCREQSGWWCESALFLYDSTAILEPLLVLSFSVERQIAILRPLQVCLRAFLTLATSVNKYF